MRSLPQLLSGLWGRAASRVAAEYAEAFEGRELLKADLAMFCNAAAPIAGDSEFERGVEEGKRRVWLHIARICGLQPEDFVHTADGARTHVSR
jgi:hypothetical protein